MISVDERRPITVHNAAPLARRPGRKPSNPAPKVGPSGGRCENMKTLSAIAALLLLGQIGHADQNTPHPLSPPVPKQVVYPTDFFEHMSADIQSLGSAYSTDQFKPNSNFKPNSDLRK